MATVSRRTLALIPALLFIAATFTAPCRAEGNRDFLWNVVANCLDPGIPGYDKICSTPITTSAAACRKTLEVWDKNPEFVFFRDIKMCDCLSDKTFVHGIVLPRSRVTGSEDPNRPAGIWRYAWDNAVKRVGNEADIALVVNPPGTGRSQDQLHVHVVRLNGAGRELIASPRATGVGNPDEIWEKADQLAREKGLAYYGVLVARNPAGGFMLFVNDRNLEYDYTVAKCKERTLP